VRPFYYYFVPGLKSEAAKLAIAKERYGLEVAMYPGFGGFEALRAGLFCDPITEFEIVQNTERRTLFNWIKADQGASLLITGEKKSDGPFRRRILSNTSETFADTYLPLRHWIKWEVLNYLRSREIPIPDPGRGDNGAMCLADAEIIHAYKYLREDFDTLAAYFPYIWTVIYRELWFGSLEQELKLDVEIAKEEGRKRRADKRKRKEISEPQRRPVEAV
jgi:hypothetical protein